MAGGGCFAAKQAVLRAKAQQNPKIILWFADQIKHPRTRTLNLDSQLGLPLQTPSLPPAEPLVKSFPPDVAALFFMLVNDIVTDTCVEHRVIDWRKTFLESPLKAQTAANDPRAATRRCCAP